VKAYAAFYDNLAPDNVVRLEQLCAPDVRFRDPFNDVTGISAYRAILDRMFADVSAPRFETTDWALSGQTAYLRWDFTFSTRKGRTPWHIEGVTELHLDEHGRVTAHLDHWDSGSQFYGRLPVLRLLISLIRNRLALSP
jgi:hypothetical protein